MSSHDKDNHSCDTPVFLRCEFCTTYISSKMQLKIYRNSYRRLVLYCYQIITTTLYPYFFHAILKQLTLLLIRSVTVHCQVHNNESIYFKGNRHIFGFAWRQCGHQHRVFACISQCHVEFLILKLISLKSYLLIRVCIHVCICACACMCYCICWRQQISPYTQRVNFN